MQHERLVLRIALENRALSHVGNRKILLMRIVPVNRVESKADNPSCIEQNAKFLQFRIPVVRNTRERLNSHLRSRGCPRHG